jgi:hypothetical protein
VGLRSERDGTAHDDAYSKGSILEERAHEIGLFGPVGEAGAWKTSDRAMRFT